MWWLTYKSGKPGQKKLPPEHFVYAISMFAAPENWPRTHFPINRTRIAYAVCTFWEGGLRKPSFTPNSIKALGAVLIGRLYFWLSSSLVLLPLSKGSAANVKLCDNRAIRHSTEFDPATSLHDGCEMIPSPAAQRDTLSAALSHTHTLPIARWPCCFPCLTRHLSPSLSHLCNSADRPSSTVCSLFKAGAITTRCIFKKWWLT